MKNPLAICLILLCTALVSHAQQNPRGPSASLAPAAASDVAPDAKAAETPAQGADVGANYLIGPGDVVQVFVWRNPELTVTVPILPDGKISTPLVEDMVAVGKTPSELARDVEKVLDEYIRSPQVNIIVTQPRSIFSQIRVIGEVGAPRAVGYRDGLTVLDVILEVGGLGQFAAGNRSHVVRTENGRERKIPVRLNDLLHKGDLKQNIPMAAGDVLVVPQSRF